MFSFLLICSLYSQLRCSHSYVLELGLICQREPWEIEQELLRKPRELLFSAITMTVRGPLEDTQLKTYLRVLRRDTQKPKGVMSTFLAKQQGAYHEPLPSDCLDGKVGGDRKKA